MGNVRKSWNVIGQNKEDFDDSDETWMSFTVIGLIINEENRRIDKNLSDSENVFRVCDRFLAFIVNQFSWKLKKTPETLWKEQEKL
jgi:hypothetical protein